MKIRDLKERYGNHDFGSLSEHQLSLLDHPDISMNYDAIGQKTVRIDNIKGNTLIITDLFEYWFKNRELGTNHVKHGGQMDYINSRIPEYKDILGNETEPTELKGGTYQFTHPDSSKTIVSFYCHKERV